MQTNSNVDMIISKVLRDFSKYNDAGLIDENELYSDAVAALKRFGNDICVPQEGFVKIQGGIGDLPQQFFSLKLAAQCEPHYYKRNGVETDAVQHSMFYRERIEVSDKWSECEACCTETTEKVIRENIYFDAGSVSFFYKNPRLLRLRPGMHRSLCSSDCVNSFRENNPNEINILNYRTIQANFNTGDIYIQYNGLPVTEEGHIEIPDTPNGNLNTYIEYHLKRRLTEVLISNNDAQGLQNMYPVFKEYESSSRQATERELKLMKATPQAFKKWRALNRAESLTYEVHTPVWR